MKRKKKLKVTSQIGYFQVNSKGLPIIESGYTYRKGLKYFLKYFKKCVGSYHKKFRVEFKEL